MSTKRAVAEQNTQQWTNPAMVVRDKLRTMLLDGSLRPGDAVRQDMLADELGISRLPVREALRMLESEGLIEHRKNFGYAVAKISRAELGESYLMRRLLETELLRHLGPVSQVKIDELRRLNDAMRAETAGADIAHALKINKEFHFSIFSLAGMTIVVEYLHKVWRLSDPYRALVLYAPESASRIAAEHDEIIDLLAGRDIEALIELHDAHRSAGEQRVLQTLDLLTRHGTNLAS